MGEFKDASGVTLLRGLTEALSGLSCLEEPQGREFFAEVLADQLGVRIDLRSGKQRGDVISLARAALSVPGGEEVLVAVVRIFEGASAAAELDLLVASLHGTTAPAPSYAVPGPVSVSEEASARVLLHGVADQLSSTALRDGLAHETGLDLPLGLSPEQLLTHVLQFNSQPDGLPPAILLMEYAAGAATTPGGRGALSTWVEDWARRAGLLSELEVRRTARAVVRTDSSIPRCLVVVVEPARDGSEDVLVRSWLNTVPGRWSPLPGEPETTTLDDLGAAVERALRQLARLSPAAPEPLPSTGRPTPPPYVEFVLPYDLLNHDMAGLMSRGDGARPLPLGLQYGVHLRSLERMRSSDRLVREQWRQRWRTLQYRGVGVYDWWVSDARRPAAWQIGLAAEPGSTATVLDAPIDSAALDALKAAIAAGIGLAVWDRRGAFVEERREVVRAVFASVPNPAQIPVAIHRLRTQAAARHDGPLMLGRHIAFLWDDPTRLVDVQEAGTGDEMYGYDSGESGT